VLNFKFEEFCNLDESPEASYLIESMKTMTSLESVQKIKRQSLSLLNLSKCDNVLEAGCGFSNDAEILAEIVGNEGSVVGIDISEQMLKKAIKNKKHNNIEYKLMNAEKINYPSHYFCAAHADRLLVSHRNYENIFIEMKRVVKQNGTLCFTDVDAKTISITPCLSINTIILDKILECFVNQDMGRKLANLFIDHNFADIQIITNLSEINDFNILKNIFNFDKILDSCITEGSLTITQKNDWMDEMDYYSQKGNFLYCVTFFTVAGKKIT